MKKDAGFTLIELLAVIVLFAVFSLVTIPILLGIIEEAKIGALKDSAYGIESTAEFMYARSIVEGKEFRDVVFTLKDGKIISSDDNFILDFKGEINSSGQVAVSFDGIVRLALYNGKYCVSKTNLVDITIEEKNSDECVVPDLPDVKPIEPNIGNDGSGATAPELSSNMIPVKWNGSTWVKANPNTPKDWYDYNSDAKKWANAVTVTETTRNAYKNAAVNTEVKEADILTYLVWVPRYKYKLFNVSSTSMNWQTIEIVFEDKTVAKSSGTKNGEYLTHPAFTFGNTELNGIWVGKFETTGSIEDPCTDEACTTASLSIKPNLTSVKNQTISSMFYATRSMQKSGNPYGFMDGNMHIMKNMEWGAVAYFTNSKYGKNSEVWINNNSGYVTGCVGRSVNASSISNCETIYSSTQGANGSTTGNIYGIYDMSGGSWEYVMGAMYNNGNNMIGVQLSGFAQITINSEEMSKYIDKYFYGTTTGDQNAYNRRLLGDATGEVHGWNKDSALFIYSSYVWFCRGGHHGHAEDAGVFHFYRSSGNSDKRLSFRIVRSAE